MPRRSNRLSLALVLLLSGNAWALGLGEIRLDSALNAPMRAQIELLSATPEELENLQVGLASQETFERYGLDRPYYLQDLRFEIVQSGSAQGNYIRVTSTKPITEPFLTFLVEAMWSRGRLLREYTVLLDPPTFAPPPVEESSPAVTAPQRSTPADSGRIERQAEPRPMPEAETPVASPRPIPAPAPRSEPEPAPQPEPKPRAGEPDLPFDSASGENFVVQRGETLWGIASRTRPDFRLTMNQMMLAIYEANPEAFGGNINILRAGARLRIPSADDIYRIDRAYALNEAKRQHAAWSGAPAPAPAAEEPVATTTRPSLQLVPPDEESAGLDTGAEAPEDAAAMTDEPAVSLREQELVDRIAELEAADVPEQQSLIEIRDNELAALRQELAEIRGELYEPEAFEPTGYETETAPDEALAEPDEAEVADTAAEEEADTPIQPPSNVISSPVRPEPSLLDRIIGIVTNTWVLIIAGALIIAGIVLFWFLRRGRAEEDEEWASAGMSAPAFDDTALSSTEALQAPSRDDESIVVVEQGSGIRPLDEDTLDAPGPEQGIGGQTPEIGGLGSMEDTFSSETAVNLDQSDPIAEADFHMAYGLYDQAADLINGALEAEADNLDLLTKLCEIYFVWGNRDAFVDAARRVKQVSGDDEGGEWDKIVIMGQQIAADDELFAGAGVAGATKAVDLTFDADTDDGGALDMDFGAGDEDAGEVIDLGGGDDEDVFDFTATEDTAEEVIDLSGAEESTGAAGSDDEGVDFVFDEEPTEEKSVAESDDVDFDFSAGEPTEDSTAEMPGSESATDTPTIEDQFLGLDATSELPSIPEAVEEAIAEPAPSAEETAEINLDELGLDVDSLAETEVASLDDIDEFGEADDDDDVTASQKILDDTASQKVLDDTSLNEALEDPAEATGRNPEIDPEATGVHESFDSDDTSFNEKLDIDEMLSATSEMRLAADETGQNPLMQQADEDTGVEFDDSLLEATGRTQILPEDFAVETTTAADVIPDEAETLLASLDDEDDTGVVEDDETMLSRTLNEDADFDFAKTEALPPDVFTGNMDLDETGEMPAVASTDVDLDLDDLTAALKVSEMGDTVDMPRDDATVEHVRPGFDESDETSEVPTMSLSPDDMSEDLHEARTMTEVGTKLDLARAYVDMGDPGGARSILEEVLDEGDESQRQQAQQLLESLPG
jgi:pilus assembly protein FimV